MVRDVCGELLKVLGYRVIYAENGKDAVRIYEKQVFDIDLIILDMIMPDMSGEATFMEIMNIKPDSRVLLSSGYSENEQAKKILDMGCGGFIQKPYSIENLSQKIRELLG